MSQSRKKTPVAGRSSATSEKRDKQTNHRRERRRVHQVLAANPDVKVLPHTRELSDPWTMAKDGREFLGHRAARRDLKK